MTKLIVVGQGYVGLPVAVRAAEVGFDVVGLDLDVGRISQLAAGECYVEEESWEQAEDQFFLATQIDRTDVTLWWQLGQSHTHQIFSPQLLIIFRAEID